MKFGTVPVEEARGSILGHSIHVSGRRLRKGAVLSDDSIAELLAAGVAEVTVATLEADDMPENDAAAELSAALASDAETLGVTVSDAFTGRANILAATAGVVRVDVDKISAFNRVNPMITIATVPDYHSADAGKMLATIKIISFAVPRADVKRAAEFLTNAIRVHQPVIKTAKLIVTEIAGLKAEKGVEAIRDRLERWGVELTRLTIVGHQADVIAGSLADSGEDLVLILTASATSDIEDVAPSAVVRAGGGIERFGLPVDPGNLLFLGYLHHTPVIGLPGCARSPALNGTDWVMARVICGVPISDRDMAAMGVGGLLKEIPTRPQPRNRKIK